MRLNLQFPANLVTFTEDILNGEPHFLRSITEILQNVFTKPNSTLNFSVQILRINLANCKKLIFSNNLYHQIISYLTFGEI